MRTCRIKALSIAVMMIIASIAASSSQALAVGDSGWDNPFADVSKDDWFYGSVEFAVKRGVMNGSTETEFAPDAMLTRAMIVTVLYRMQADGNTKSTTQDPQFSDVLQDEWYTDAVAWAAEDGIVTGYGDGTFGPGDPVTREQLAAILHRYAGIIDAEAGFPENNALEGFADTDMISGWALDAIKWCVSFDFIKGIPEGEGTAIKPRGAATRAQYASILQRFIGIFIDGDGKMPLPPLPPASPSEDFGIDMNINIDTIDDWLGRDDVVYRDVRMLIDDADFDAMGGSAATVLKWTIKGFKIVPYPYLANVSALPPVVGDAYAGRSLFYVEREQDGGIVSVAANYQESMMIIEELFPKDKAIFLLCGGAGYSYETKVLLTYLGWDESRIYVVGRGWDYDGGNVLPLYMPSEEEEGKYTFATWRADYALFSFEMLTPFNWDLSVPSGTYSVTPELKKSSGEPLPPANPDLAGYGVDRAINMSTIDDWLDRDDVAYIDLRMLFDSADFSVLEKGLAYLSDTLRGFKIISYPFMAIPNRMPVTGAYDSKTLFSVSWDPDRNTIIETDIMENYEESRMALEELFPKDKAIFLLSGWVGYATEMKTLLKWYGWDESKIYIVGSYWDYEGVNSLQLVIPSSGDNEAIFATWRADFAIINFNFLNPFLYYDGTPPPSVDPNNPGCSLMYGFDKGNCMC